MGATGGCKEGVCIVIGGSDQVMLGQLRPVAQILDRSCQDGSSQVWASLMNTFMGRSYFTHNYIGLNFFWIQVFLTNKF